MPNCGMGGIEKIEACEHEGLEAASVFKGVCFGAGQPQAKAVPVTMNEMLLRGCTLKNTGYILGLAVYTGGETRIQKNSAKTPNKIGKSWPWPLAAVFSLSC